ncbi:MAG: formylglycine-generating enzyme family protein [Flavobacteriaceae bacterium]|nr:formylglycine-generating enzyme family protein [Flavobacteriaceae bacterium]MCY4216805.1 formylglycine-generating enzyme family protein [Flavobacteriaceae bacterium]MCY4253868.1 formylglycine-generating enzyme family protein [Flavobacteriaceae bacterium]
MNHKIARFHVILIMILIHRLIYAQSDYQQIIPETQLSIDMVYVKGGPFMMGSPETEKGRYGDEGPQHPVEIDDFWIGKYEISWDIYKLFLDRHIDNLIEELNSSEVEIRVDAISGATPPYTDMSFGMGINGYPAIGMTQHAANTFCQWLSAITGKFYRLPTEAEWEYAARAGNQSRYSFGDDERELDQFGWYQKNSDGKYQPIGQKNPNPWGLYDMHGNVSEWTLDQYISNIYQLRDSLVLNPYEIPTKRYPRSVRGGSWKDFSEKLRSAARGRSSSTWKLRDPQIPKSIWWHTDADFVGFRILRPKNTPSPEQQLIYWQSAEK